MKNFVSRTLLSATIAAGLAMGHAPAAQAWVGTQTYTCGNWNCGYEFNNVGCNISWRNISPNNAAIGARPFDPYFNVQDPFMGWYYPYSNPTGGYTIQSGQTGIVFYFQAAGGGQMRVNYNNNYCSPPSHLAG